MNYYYVDKEASRQRIMEIDALRAEGGKTDLETWWRSFDTKKKAQVRQQGQRIYISFLNIETKEEIHYKGLKQCCKDHELDYAAVKSRVYKSKNNKITVDEKYVIERIEKIDESKYKEEVRKKYVNSSWAHEDAKTLVDMKLDGYTYPQIAEVLGKSIASCQSKFKRLEKDEMIEFYKNYQKDLGEKV